jgi:hypothetical protein
MESLRSGFFILIKMVKYLRHSKFDIHYSKFVTKLFFAIKCTKFTNMHLSYHPYRSISNGLNYLLADSSHKKLLHPG